MVALSTTEAEYMAPTTAAKEAIWLRKLCAELGFEQESVKIHCDSQSAIALAKNHVHHERTKHIDNKYHFIRDVIVEGKVHLSKIHTSKLCLKRRMALHGDEVCALRLAPWRIEALALKTT